MERKVGSIFAYDLNTILRVEEAIQIDTIANMDMEVNNIKEIIKEETVLYQQYLSKDITR